MIFYYVLWHCLATTLWVTRLIAFGSTARSVTSRFYLNRVSRKALCETCFNSELSHYRIANYLADRHYLHLRSPSRLDKCVRCSQILTCPIISCCSQVHARYVLYLIGTGEQSWNNSKSTIMTISQTRGSSAKLNKNRTL